MIIAKKYHLVVLFLFFLSGTKAQQCASLQLEAIFHSLSNQCELPSESGVFDARPLRLPLRIAYDSEGQITHLGVAVFSKSEQKTIGKTLCNFQERYLLDVLLQPGDEQVKELLERDKTVIHTCGIAIGTQFKQQYLNEAIRRIIDGKPRYTLVHENYVWGVLWEDELSCLGFKFPSDIQLIMGMDKKEIGLFFEQQLRQFQHKPFEPAPLILDAGNLQTLRKDMFVYPGSTFFIREMKSDIYLRKDSISGYKTVFDINYPEESIANLFISPGQWAEKLEINILHKGYDATPAFNENLYHLLSFLDKDFETYFGIEHLSSEKVEFSVVFRNKDYTFYHLLFVQTNLEAIFTGKEPLNGTLYTYIPNQNVKNLYLEREWPQTESQIF